MINLICKSSIAQGLLSFYKNLEESNKTIELYKGTLIVDFNIADEVEIKRHWIKINANDCIDGDATFIKIWINSTIKLKNNDDENKINDIRKMINHANRNLVFGKIWLEEYSAMNNIRWYSYTQIFDAEKISKPANSVNLLYKNSMEEFSKWYPIFTEIAKEKSDFIKILKKFKIDLMPYG
jgi:hypothetical protein